MLPNITDICTIRKDEENLTRCHQNANTGPGYHQRNGQVCRESSGNSPCFSLGSSALQSPIQFRMNAVHPAPYQQGNLASWYNTKVRLDEQSWADLRWWTLLDRKIIIESPIRQPRPSMLIRVNASTRGWGAVLNTQTRTRGVWSVQEATNHINYLELLAAFLALKSFGKTWSHMTVLLRLDNFTAVTYINRKGGTCSQRLCQLAISLWEWCQDRNITLLAEHLPGILNAAADAESRTERDRCDWMLNPAVFQRIMTQMGPLEIDLFASRLTRQLPCFYSWRPDPKAEATDAFLHAGLGKGTRFCQPTLVPHTPVLNQGQDRGGENGPNGSLAENAIMVPGITGATGGLSKSSPTSTRSSSDAIRSGFSNATRSPNTDRLFHLRESFTSQGFSPEASDLMLASWRPKTNTNYGSCFA